jgi:general L-amino acid transport system permease protein
MPAIEGADRLPPSPPGFSWNDPRTRAMVWQLVVVACAGLALALVVMQTATNLRLRGIASGFDYLGRAAGFEIARGPLSYSSRDTYARALALGLLNTLRVSLLGIVIACALGLVIGIARLSNIWVVSATSRVYVEVLRNTPLLLQLLFWYALSQALPATHDALNPVPGVFLSNRGLFLPRLVLHEGSLWLGGALLAFVVLVPVVVARSRLRRDRTGHGLPTARLLAASAVVLLSVAIAIGRPVVGVERPAVLGFNFRGGLSISPEFAALLIGLSTYTAAFIGEIVRGGVLAVDRGQSEAAKALGLSRGKVLRLVVLPQALRVITLPTTSQFLNLLKNSSLAVAIGYPDLISITNTAINQTGQAIEAIALAAAIYLVISLAISVVMNVSNDTVALRGQEARQP